MKSLLTRWRELQSKLKPQTLDTTPFQIHCHACGIDYTVAAAVADEQTQCRNCLKPLRRTETGLMRVGDLLPDILPPGLFDEVIRPEDVAYTHSLFLQCFLPVRHHKTNALEWECGNRNAKLLITAGKLMNPAVPGQFRRCAVPAGSMARIAVTYVNNYIYRRKTPVVDLGESLRDALKKMNVPIGGANGKALTQELQNFAAADITFGLWFADGNAQQDQAKVARRLTFWIDKHPEQGTLWQPEMVVSDEYYQSVRAGGHMAPIYMPDYIDLRAKPRAQDVYTWLCYRLRNPLKRPALIPAVALHAVFGSDIKLMKHFWPEFKTALNAARQKYPAAEIEVLKDGSGIRLHTSPPRIPYRKIGLIE